MSLLAARDRTVQWLLNDSAAYADILGAREKELRQRYATVCRRSPRKAEFWIARELRVELFAAMAHLVYVEVLEMIEPWWQERISLVAAITPTNYCMGDLSVPYSGACHVFMQTLTAWLQAASDRVITRLRQDANDPNAPLWGAFETAGRRVGEAILAYKPAYDGYYQNHPSAAARLFETYDSWQHDSMPVNAEAIMGALILWAAAGTHAQRRSLSVRELARQVNSWLDPISWMAHASRRSMVSYFHGPESISRRFGQYEGRVLTDLADFLPESIPVYTENGQWLPQHWAKAGLQDGPWDPNPGDCPATTSVQPPSPKRRRVVVSFCAEYQRRYPEAQIIWLASEEKGLCDIATLGLMVGCLIAQETIYPVWPRVILG
ncbi:MAG TPA: hypothetical protein VLI05_02020 [Candidatus Saccharimonadia bacterium]|nr:hypothetical protein [Candidatus Saccharimonadia bacterium]